MMTQVFTGPPTITIHPTSQFITVSMNVILNCEGTGGGSITYQWESSNINRENWMNISRKKNLMTKKLKQSRQYRCAVSNNVGRTLSNVATVTILSKYIYILKAHDVIYYI